MGCWSSRLWQPHCEMPWMFGSAIVVLEISSPLANLDRTGRIAPFPEMAVEAWSYKRDSLAAGLAFLMRTAPVGRPQCAACVRGGQPGPRVRIPFPPAKSLLRTRFLMGMGFRNAVFRSYGARSPLPGRALRLRSDRAVAVAGEVADLHSAGIASCGRCASALSRTPSARRSAASRCRRVTGSTARARRCYD
jgi:hypothetical protein